MTVAIVGTFDVENFGDLLFPILAEAELGARCEGVEVVPYSYRAMSDRAWPYEVRPLEQLERDIAQTELVLIGGGALIRFDRDVAPGYAPTNSHVHHPTGLWLGPSLTALGAGVPLVWNSVGVFGSPPPWIARLIAAILEDSAAISVRDRSSAATLAQAGAPSPRVSPDTAFGAARLMPGEPSPAWRSVLERAGSGERYVLLQPSKQLQDEQSRVAELVDAAAAQGLDVLELPISPALGDRPGVLGAVRERTRAIDGWPDPVTIVELIGRSQAVIAQSLHMSIVAACHGVPVHRPPWTDTDKYALLEGLDAVRTWNGAAGDAPVFGAGEPGSRVRELSAEVAGHWDDVARVLNEGGGRRAVRTGATVATAVESILDELDTMRAQRDWEHERRLEVERRPPLKPLLRRVLGRD